MPTVLGRVVGAAVAEAVALSQGAVEQDELGVCLAQSAQQTGRAGGQEIDDRGGVGVRGADRDAEPGGDLCERLVLA